MRDVSAKMRECGKSAKMRDFPHDCGTVDTYGLTCGVTAHRFATDHVRGSTLSQTMTKANINQAESLGTLPMLIGWNGLLLVDTSATDRPVAKHPLSYLNTCKCHFFRIAIKARKKIVMTPNCSQCAISRLKM